MTTRKLIPLADQTRVEFEKLVLMLQDVLPRTAFRRLGNVADAEDIAQETLLRVWKNIAKYETMEHAMRSACKISLNLVIDQLRKSASRKSMPLLDDDDNPVQGMHQMPTDFHIRQEENELIRAAMEKLDEEDREILMMRYWLELSMEEIADRLGIKKAAATQRVHRARLRLKKTLLKLKVMDDETAQRLHAE